MPEVPMRRVRRSMSSLIVITEVVATVCQFIQRTDPRFPLVYFTVCSGVLAGAVALADVGDRRNRTIEPWRIVAAVGVLLSAVVFVFVIAPATPTGTWFQPWDDPWVRVATVCFHGVAPVLVVAHLVLRPPALLLRGWIAAAYSWPIVYLAAVTVSATALHLELPYPFLSPSQMGWGAVSVAAMAACIVVTAVALHALARTVGRRVERGNLSESH